MTSRRASPAASTPLSFCERSLGQIRFVSVGCSELSHFYSVPLYPFLLGRPRGLTLCRTFHSKFVLHSLRFINPGPKGMGHEEVWHAALAGAVSGLAVWAEKPSR